MNKRNHFIYLSLITLSLSCGKNAFVELSSSQIIQTATEAAKETRFYTGSATDGLNGPQGSLFLSELSTNGEKYIEDFSLIPLGRSKSVVASFGQYNYEINHLDDSSDQTQRDIYIESPVAQSGAQGEGTGLDFAFGSTTTKNTMLITFNKPIAHFGIDLLDFESSSNFTLGQIILNDCSVTPKIIQTQVIDFGPEDGNSEVHFFGFIADSPIVCSVQILVGDDGLGDGKAEKFAVDNLRFGTSSLK